MTAQRSHRASEGVRPTVKTLAEVTGYSIATVSKALNDSPVVTEDTKERIREAARQIGYSVNPRAASLRTGKTFHAAVLMPISVAEGHEWNGVEYAEILSGISQALEGSPYQLSIHPIRDAAEGVKAAEAIVRRGLADGIAFSGVLQNDPRIEFLSDADFPFVAMGRCDTPKDYAFVDIDSHWLTLDATRRLIAGGHRRIALINPIPSLAYAQSRIAGFRAAFAEADLPDCDDLIAEGDLTARFGRDSVQRLCGGASPPTGFVCVNEATTLGVLAGLRDLGLSAGRDVSVIAYDDLNVSEYLAPPLTTYFQPVEDLGRTLGDFLLRRMAGELPSDLQKVFRPILIPRQPDRLAEAGHSTQQRRMK
ncbi:LacI family DNA-binding transcriptional regulator [Frigidibacter sp. SD6-1]|uniref:LacI family DNA-binding transcriptional regulator n=1 Tax=Frigidibacter sp. SD6-1 TaxID=3032581 RepID=UPI0024DF3D61|nr:LacI family DNA-binding transcriptional regulator [Frigidibacter sp. SD6-1]